MSKELLNQFKEDNDALNLEKLTFFLNLIRKELNWEKGTLIEQEDGLNEQVIEMETKIATKLKEFKDLKKNIDTQNQKLTQKFKELKDTEAALERWRKANIIIAKSYSEAGNYEHLIELLETEAKKIKPIRRSLAMIDGNIQDLLKQREDQLPDDLQERS